MLVYYKTILSVCSWNFSCFKIVDDYCIHVVNYTVVLMDVLNGIMEEVKVDANSCVDDICSIAFYNLLLNQTYSITVTATNILGSSIPAVILCKVVNYS